MKIKAFAGKRRVLILGTVFAIAIVSIIAIFVVKQPNEAEKRAKPAEHEVPAEIRVYDDEFHALSII